MAGNLGNNVISGSMIASWVGFLRREVMAVTDDVLPCVVIMRLNRFVVLVDVDGVQKRAYINNTGRLLDILVPGRQGFCIRNHPQRRTEFRLIAVLDRGAGALIDTRIQEEVFAKLVNESMIPWLKGCVVARRAPKIGESRLDYILRCGGRDVFIELKSAVLRGPDDVAMYPDCPTSRGERHIGELIALAKKGLKGYVVFMAALPEVHAFTPYDAGDPKIRVLLREAKALGVGVKAIAIHYEPKDSVIVLDNPDLPVLL